MVYKSGQIFLPFCHNPRVWRTDRQTDRQTDRRTDGHTEISSQYRVWITCSAVKTAVSRWRNYWNYKNLVIIIHSDVFYAFELQNVCWITVTTLCSQNRFRSTLSCAKSLFWNKVRDIILMTSVNWARSRRRVLYNFGRFCVSVCLSDDNFRKTSRIGSSYLHIPCISRQYGSSSYIWRSSG